MEEKKLSLFETQKAIKYIKDLFQNTFSKSLNLHRITGPIVLKQHTGLNDDLNGVENPVRFESNVNSIKGEIPQSLAKWKRYILKEYDVPLHQGVYVDMNAIRKDETISYKHSIYVDQWDWELRITRKERSLETLKKVVSKIYEVLVYCQNKLYEHYDWEKKNMLPEKITFITSQQLLDMYPDMDDKERERNIAYKYKAVFIIGIGHKLSNGLPHDDRAPDYDDWNLNGDIIVWDDVNKDALELSSMGVRVDSYSLLRQLEIKGLNERLSFPFHKALSKDELPFSIGGGIGQSRLCLFLLGKKHIGEVQVSVWPEETINEYKARGIKLL